MQRAGAVERPKGMTLEEWAALDDEIEGELVDGFLEEEEMANVLHEAIVTWLAAVLRVWVRRHRGVLTGSEVKIAIAPRRGRKPDVSVFLPPHVPAPTDTLVRVPPHLAFEIASPRPRDARRDRLDKLADYARAGVPYYCIIDPQLRSVEIYELGRDRRYTVARTAAGGRVRVPGCPGLVLDLEALWSEADEVERAHARAARRR
jgi:Uma2 family endonuclease